MNTSTMQLKNDNREELMLLVSMQALVRGTLIRKSLMELRAEFEEINKEIEGGASARVSTDWPANTPCRPTFKLAKEDSGILQRLAEKGWCKLQPLQQSKQSEGTEGDAGTQQYSSDFQSRSSLSSEESVQPSSVGSSLPLGSGAEGDKPSAHIHPENSHVDNEGLTDVQSSVKPIKEITENTQLLEQTMNMEEHLTENLDASKSLSSAKSDREAKPNGERESPFKSGSGVESIPVETFDERGESERSRGTGDNGDHAPVRGGCHGEKMMHRQSLNETDFTLVSSMEASSVHLSSLDDESISGNVGLEDERLGYGGVETTSNSEVMDDLDQGGRELRKLLSLTSLGDQSSSNRFNNTSAADIGAKMDNSEELHSKVRQEEQIRQRSSTGQDGPQQSSSQTSQADSSSLVPISNQSSNGERRALHSRTMGSLPHDGDNPSLLRTCGWQTSLSQGSGMESKESKHVDPKQKQSAVTSKGSIGRSLGAMGVDPDHSRQSSMQDDHQVSDLDASVAADMTSIWSTDLSDIDDEQVPQRDEAKLKEMRNNMAMELLWIQQAIESRKNYLRLKSKMTCSDKTDQ